MSSNLIMAKHFNYLDFIPRDIMASNEFSLTKLDMAGGRYAAKTLSVITSIAKAALTGKDKIHVNMFRYSNKDLFKLWTELLNIFEPFLKYAYINNSKYILRLKNVNINLWSLNTSGKKTKLTGLAGANSKYLINLLEEAHEFSNTNKSEIAEATRGADHKLTITTTNPWSLRQDHIKYLNDHMAFNEQELGTKGYQQKLVTPKHFIDYTNWRVNELLKQPDYDAIQDIIRNDPVRARIVSIGMPAMEQGAIFTNYLTRVIERPREMRINRLAAGIDLGYVKDLSACVLTGIGTRFLSCENEMAFDNTQSSVKNNYKVFIDICLKWLAQEQVKFQGIKYIDIKIDSENLLAPIMFNERARELGLDQRLQARPSKKRKIQERTTGLTELMGKGQMYINNKCAMLLRDLELAAWDTTKGKLQRTDPLGEHYLNAAEYSFDVELLEILTATRTNDIWLVK